MNNEPMSDERIEIARKQYAGCGWPYDDLLGEIDRLRRENTLIREADMRPANIQQRRADRAEAALARVIDDSMGEQLKVALIPVLSNASNYPGRASAHMLGQDTAPLRQKVIDAAVAAIRAVAAGEQTEGGER